MAICPAPSPDESLVRGLLTSVDCNVQSLGATAYGALAQPGSVVSAALTSVLTLYVGWMGFRMIVGRAPLRVGDLTLTALKIGLVLTLATSWSVYQALVFDTLFRGPEQLAGSLLTSGGGSSQPGNPFDRLQAVYNEMQASAAFLSGRTLGAPSPLQGGPAFAAFALNTSALLMMLASLGVVLASKIVLGLLLGLGPVFVLFLLFDSTRGLFEGWLRASLAAAISPLMAIFALVVQLTLLEPHVVRLAELRTQGLVDLAPANAIFLLTMVCTMVSAGLGLAIAVIAFSLRLPGLGQSAPTAGKTASAVTPAAQSRPVIDARSTAGIELQTRAASIAAAAAALERRDVRTLSGAAGGSAGGPRSPGMAAPREGNTSVWASAQSLPSTLRRSATPRRSSSNLRRDG